MNEKEREDLEQEIVDLKRFLRWKPIVQLGRILYYIGIAYLVLVLLLVYFGYLHLGVWW